MTDDDDLGIYYKCYRGRNSHFALSEPHSFNVNDAAGRDWICFPVPREVVESDGLLMDLVDVQRADEKSGEDTVVRLIFCQDKQELASKLIEAAEESEDK